MIVKRNIFLSIPLLFLGVIPVCSVSEGTNFSWIFQSPSHLVEVSNPGLSTYNCDSAAADCKVNFDFRASIPTVEPSTHYACVIDFGFGTTGEEAKCNPNTVDFPVGTSHVHVIVKKIADNSIVAEGILDIVRTNGSIDPLRVTSVKEWQSPSSLLLKEDSTLDEYTCDSAQSECKINLLITPKLDGEISSQITCEITGDFTLVATADPCSPNTSLVPTGDHVLTIKILDKSKNSILQTSTITLKNPVKDTNIDPARISLVRTWQSPTYLLSSEDSTLGSYSCDPEKSECKINLLIIPKLDGIESPQLTCEITTDFSLISTTDPCNPNTSIVPLGDHIMSVKILDKTKNVVLKTYEVTLKNPVIDTTIDPTKVMIDIVWQQPTYLLERDNATSDAYTCDPDKTECRINLLVMPKLDGVESSRLSCHIMTDFDVEENDCNPDTFSVPSGNHAITVEAKNNQTGEIASTRTFIIHGLPAVMGGSEGGSSSPMNLSGSIITVQSGLDERNTCKTDICQVNFLADAPLGALCNWDFSGGTFETLGTNQSCNPGYVKFSHDALVTLTVTDPQTNNHVMQTLQVYHDKTNWYKTQDIVLQAHIELQSKIDKNKRIVQSGIICALGGADKCNLNFNGDESIGAKTWYWDFGDGTSSVKENPGSHSFGTGKYIVRLIVSDGITSHSVTYEVEVVQKLKPDELCSACKNMIGKIQISATLPNPPHADTVEWIEIQNISHESIPLDACEIADDSGSFELSGSLSSGKTLRLRQIITGLSMGNTHELLTLSCGTITIDTFAWNFPIPTSYVLRRDVLYARPVQGIVTHVVDGDTLDAVIEGKQTRIRLIGIDTPETVHPRKPVEEFGKEASEYTRKTLEGKTVWLTFDAEPIDHYGRRLAYVWECSGVFSEDTCTLFNAKVVSGGYGRMERRFEFRLYEDFDTREKQAKTEKRGIWNDSEVAKEMNALSSDEKEMLTTDQEKEYLKLQAELLEECKTEENEGCEEKKPTWEEITEKISTFNASIKKSGIVSISGRTWGNFPVEISLYEGDIVIQKISMLSSDSGEYETTWTPSKKGTYRFEAFLKKDDQKITMRKELLVENVSVHFDELLSAGILLQGQITDNRWQTGDVFHCRSRGSCSLNVTAESNRADNVDYWWIFPDGSVDTEKNPSSIKLDYGQYEIILIATDAITGEVVTQSLTIDHKPIPKKPKKSSTSTKYMLDLKDVPQDIGGGVLLEEKGPFRKLITNLLLLLSLSVISYVLLRKS